MSVVEQHRAAGRTFEAAGVRSFVRENGDGEPVVCMHGVPASSFLYRKVIDELAQRKLRGVAFDLPGLGLADRPANYDYSWTGLGRFSAAAVDALDLDRFHLVVHDIGGPIGFELARVMPDRIRSLTVLNTIVDAQAFRRPWVMQPFAMTGVRWVWLKSMTPSLFAQLMYMQGIEDRTATPKEELLAYHELLMRLDGGRAFLSIMQSFELTATKSEHYKKAVSNVPYPVQIIWGDRDPALTFDKHAAIAQEAAGLSQVHRLPAKHFLQEDHAPEIATRIAAIAGLEP